MLEPHGSRSTGSARATLLGQAGETFGPGTVCRAEGAPSSARCGTENSVSALLVAFGVVFLAELGDKSQLLAMTLAARRPAAHVLLGVSLAALLLQGLSAGLGAAVASAVPRSTVVLIAGLSLLVAAVLTLHSGDDDRPPTVARAGSTVLLSFAALSVAELGDKTMLATAALAAREAPLMTWLGGTAGFVLADALAVAVGMTLFRRLPMRALRLGSAGLFGLLGAVLLAGLL